MLLHALIPITALVCSALSEPIPTIEKLHARDKLTLTTDDVDRLDLYAQYAAAAPCNVERAVGEQVKCAMNCDRVEGDESTVFGTYHGDKTKIAAYMAVAHARRQLIFSVRGSSNIENWITNFSFLTTPSDLVKGGWIHIGFQTAWREISDEVNKSIAEAVAKYPGYNLVFVGHSLGGAVATIAAANLRNSGYEIDLYTYGAPRVGNGKLSEFMTNQPGRHYRVTHRGDPVPRLPPTFPPFNIFNYRHISPEYWLQGEPADPNNWPVDDIKVCEGGLNLLCNSNPFVPVKLLEHMFYFGPMKCWIKDPVDFIEGTYLPESIQQQLLQYAEDPANPEQA